MNKPLKISLIALSSIVGAILAIYLLCVIIVAIGKHMIENEINNCQESIGTMKINDSSKTLETTLKSTFFSRAFYLNDFIKNAGKENVTYDTKNHTVTIKEKYSGTYKEKLEEKNKFLSQCNSFITSLDSINPFTAPALLVFNFCERTNPIDRYIQPDQQKF
jgi:hypothetical protein